MVSKYLVGRHAVVGKVLSFYSGEIFATVSRQGNQLLLVSHYGKEIPARISRRTVAYSSVRVAKQHMNQMKEQSGVPVLPEA